ncbi:DUF1963 domain-containing protein [Roseomonas sp. AR75]|uniref:DUF1963 domain-containing protein n=1 Tax=Roseomonas sp. AR75 TaxID=2562311 RepID=UPI0010C0983E|nr:DUF1963 domain-containing protein [Roseomonas sp. AR75]
MPFKLFGKKPSATTRPDIAEMLAEAEVRSGAATRAKEVPAWALLLRSPYKSYPEPTSWLGGTPKVPPTFQWPEDKDGRALHFVAQIDLAALKPEPSTGARAPGLPAEGALLAFIGNGHAVRVLSRREMEHAVATPPPSTLPDLSEHGFWGPGSTFGHWPVDPVAYVSRGEERPAFLPDPFATPQQWITNWGLAALEASLAHDALALELRQGREFMEQRRSQAALGRALPSMPHIERRIAHCALLEERAPAVLDALQDWRATCAARPAETAVDVSALAAIFAVRTRLSAAMQSNYGARTVLAGTARAVWQKLLADAPGTQGRKDFSAIATAYRPFVEARITDWRGHRLFGIEPEFPNNFEDLRNQSPLISIAADELLGTQSEHDYGFSVWLEDQDVALGRYTGGQFIQHCAV